MLHGYLGKQDLELLVFFLEFSDFRAVGFTEGIAQEPFLSGFQEVFAPVVVEVGIDAFSSADSGNAFFGPEAFEDDADLFFKQYTFFG